MQRQLEQIIVAATLAFLLGCHAGLSKLLPLIPALILAALFLLLLAWCCRQKAGVKLLAAAGIGLCFCCGAASGSGAMRVSRSCLCRLLPVRKYVFSAEWKLAVSK